MISYLLLITLITAQDHFSTDLSTIQKSYSCPKSCTFNHSLITSKTIKEWPTCPDVCGFLSLTSESDVGYSELKEAFSKNIQLSGGIRIMGTSFRNLSFFSKAYIFGFYCDIFGTHISNNSKLENIKGILNIYQYPNRKTLKECPFQMQNNPKLDASILCKSEYFKDKTDLDISGNWKDCGCQGDIITQKSLITFNQCTTINKGLLLSNLSWSNQLSALSNVISVKGNVEIRYSDFMNLTFLSKLRTINSKSDLLGKQCFVNIHDNPSMKRLGWDQLKTIKNQAFGLLFLNIQNLNPQFCLTYEEIIMFMKISTRFKNLHANICDITDNTTDKLCFFENLINLEWNCSWIHGDLIIDSGDEQLITKLESVTRIFGSLVIRNTKLENVDFLKNLKTIAHFQDSPWVIRISSNLQMTSFRIPKIQPILSRNMTTRILIEDSPGLFTTSKWCWMIQFNTKKNVSYNGANCWKINLDRFGTDETNLQVPVFHASFLLITFITYQFHYK